jgi:hypothetical protein
MAKLYRKGAKQEIRAFLGENWVVGAFVEKMFWSPNQAISWLLFARYSLFSLCPPPQPGRFTAAVAARNVLGCREMTPSNSHFRINPNP